MVEEINARAEGIRIYPKREVLVDNEDDINAVIRENFAFLKRQMTHDRIIQRLIAEDGQGAWDERMDRFSLVEMAKQDSKLKFRLEEIIADFVGVKGWHFQTEDFNFPEPTRGVISASTGISVKRLEQIDSTKQVYESDQAGTLPMKVPELIAIANAMNVTIAYLLSPSGESLEEVATVRYPEISRVSRHSTPVSSWVMWLHNLVPLDEQNPKFFERNLSYPPATTNERVRNAAIPADEVVKEIKRTQKGAQSLYDQVNNFEPLVPNDIVEPSLPLDAKERNASDIERNIVRRNTWLFIELRKVLSKSNRFGGVAKVDQIFLVGMQKVKNQCAWIMRFLRHRDGLDT